MKNSPPSRQPRRSRGIALVIVLCFVVLITGLVVAYFSRTLTTRQLASASTSSTQAEMLANSATDEIVGDIKAEIADPIASATPNPALPAGNTFYVPLQAKYVVPQRNAITPAPAVEPMPNLVRRSLRDDAAGKVNALATPASSSRASAAASDTPSANGRFVSTARWNRHYLIPTAAPAGPSASLTASTPVADFKAPDWVFVTGEKGPVVLSAPSKDASGTAVTVTGRYAYAIYDEGGLLDSNYTGFPSASLATSHLGAKPGPSYADLSQLGLTAANVDNLLGWRNYATLQPTGSFPGLQPPNSTATDAAYYNLFFSNPRNLLQVPLTLWNNKTDQRFLSRQQLINYFAAASLDPKYLQYLGTFSRSLNQPSYLPEHSTTTLDPIRPPVLQVAAGGNDSAANTHISPNFLAARVVNTFTRYDTTAAVVGEPLVKKRFPLNRLAWLTYKGPSADRNLSDPDMVALLAAGITADFLKQGTSGQTGNVMTYFGLSWDAANKWTYGHGGGGILNVYNPDSAVTTVASQNPGREPDFFELLKASINPGSIAKTSLSPNILNRSVNDYHAAQDQYNRDVSLDIAILQIGANIIDQFDTDGFPTQINYTNLGPVAASGSVFGDENLPYISRVRNGLLHLVESNPPETTVDPGGTASAPGPLLDTGVAALMQYPEIWNQHDWDSALLAQSVGTVAPKNFKIYAKTNDSDNVRLATTVFVWDQPHHVSSDANPALSPGFASLYHFNFGPPSPATAAGGEARYLAESNTLMTFNLDPGNAASETLFREPTVLFTPGVPSGSGLASPAMTQPFLISDPDDSRGLGHVIQNPTFFGSSGGLKSAVGASSATYNPIPGLGTAYIGFYIGAHPLRFWYSGLNSPPTPTNSPAYQTQLGPTIDAVYTLGCDDGNGGVILYDVKAITTQGSPNASLQVAVDSGFGMNGTSDLDYGVRYYQTIDPRTSRFGMIDPWISSNTDSIPPRKGYSIAGTRAQLPSTGVFETDRKGANSGSALFMNFASSDWFPPAMGWYPSNVLHLSEAFRPGMLTQNNPNVTPDGVIAPGLPAEFTAPGPFSPFYYADPDGVVRRAMGGGVDGTGTTPASTTTGLPMASAKGAPGTGTLANSTNGYNSSGTPANGSDYPTTRQIDSRPSILNRPFRSVAELGYVFSGTPWKNLDFFQPESGDSAMLDVFCVNDYSDANAMTAGQVNLNTHQVPVLQAILAQASKDQWNDGNAHFAITGTTTSGQAQGLAQLLVNRTVSGPASGPNANTGPQPLQNVSDLVGRWVTSKPATSGGIDGKASYDGFTADAATYLDAAAVDQPMHNIQRFGEGAVRALSNAGQTRVWNLMFDIVAQTGRFPSQSTKLDQFNVEGEQHYWVHVAIDRYTGQILDKQVEVVKE